MNFINSYWAIFAAIIGFVIWLVRLEGKVGFVESNISKLDARVDILQEKHDSLDSKLVEQLSNVRESLARIEGSLGIKKGDHNEERF